MLKHLFLALTLCLTLVLSGCQPSSPAAPPAGTVSLLLSDRPRAAVSTAPEADQKTLTQANAALAVDLYQALRKQAQGNLVFSPFSLSQALAMTYAGARGQTAQQMAQTLHFTLPPDRLHPAFNALDLALQAPGAGSGAFQLDIANAVWGQKGYPFQAGFLDLLAGNYGAGVRLADFQNAPEPSRQAINQWVSAQTKNKINDLFAAEAIGPDTRLVLVNAVYFHAQWLHRFDPSLSQPGNFNFLEGTQAPVTFMSLGQATSLNYAQAAGYQAVELPYAGQRAAMTLIVPDAGHFADVQAALTAGELEALGGRLAPTELKLTLPKFNEASSFGLADTLGQLGMPDAFQPSAADFSGMDGRRDLYISKVVHKAMLTVDETGTEAEAGTGVGMALTAARIEQTLTVDRPFLFIIRDTQTGSILFMGQVLDPR